MVVEGSVAISRYCRGSCICSYFLQSVKEAEKGAENKADKKKGRGKQAKVGV